MMEAERVAQFVHEGAGLHVGAGAAVVSMVVPPGMTERDHEVVTMNLAEAG